MDTTLKYLQRNLRKNMPTPEVLLWQRLRNNQLGVKFRRQYTIERRILDFYAPSLKLGIEVDGESHFISSQQRNEEIKRDQELFTKYGIRILRVLNSEVMKNLDGILEKIVSLT